MLAKSLLVLVGGGIGSVCRYLTSLAAARLFGAAFPWGTLIVNLVGCFLVGCAFALAERNTALGPSGRLFLMTGFLGGLTTFSSYALESVNAASSGAPWLAVAHVAANNIAGLCLVVAGMSLVKMWP